MEIFIQFKQQRRCKHLINKITSKMEIKEGIPKAAIRRHSCINDDNTLLNSFDYFISLLQKERNKRSHNNIKLMSQYLSSHYQYFIQLKETSDVDLMHKLVSSLNYETFKKRERIINCGDEGDKFYILLKGKISVHKPIPYSVTITLREYVEYIYKVKFIEKNYPKFDRITRQNAWVDHYSLLKMNYDYTKIKQSKIKQQYTIEEEKKLAECTDGEAFGEMALIKKEPRNASIYAEEDSILVSLEKYDYNKVIREVEEKRLATKAIQFKKKFPIFNYWGINQLFRLFNYFEKETITYGEYLYKQNQPSEYIYFLDNGIFEMTSFFSFGWYEEFVDFIHNTNYSVANKINQREIFDNDDNFREFIKKGNTSMISPCVFYKKNMKFFNSLSAKNDDILDVKLEQDNLKSPKISYCATVKQISIPECLGYEDALELKPRYTSVKCLSSIVDYQKVNIVQFIKLLPYDPTNQFVFQKNIFERKTFLIHQLKNNALFRMNAIDNILKEKFINAIKKEYPFTPKTYLNDKRMLKTLRKEDLFNRVEVSKDNNNNSNLTMRKNRFQMFNPEKSQKIYSLYSFDKGIQNKSVPSLMSKDFNNQMNQTVRYQKPKKVSVNQSLASFSPLTVNESENEIKLHEFRKIDVSTNRNNKLEKSKTYKSLRNPSNECDESSTKLIDAQSHNNSQLSKSYSSIFINNMFHNGNISTKLKNTALINSFKEKYQKNEQRSDLNPNKQLPKIAEVWIDKFLKDKINKNCFMKLQNKKLFLNMNNNDN